MQELPKISIVLPVFNGEKHLRDSITSCLSQTYTNLEIIIVNDGSQDESEKIVRGFKDPRIIYHRHDRNRGLPQSLNTGFKLASGDYLTLTGHDNIFSKEAIEKMYNFLKLTNSHFVYCDYYSFNDEDIGNRKLIELEHPPNLAKVNAIGPCFLWSREVMDNIGLWDESMMLVEDYDYWIRIFKKYEMAHMPKALYFYRVHAQSLTARYSRHYEIKIASMMIRYWHDLVSKKASMNKVIDFMIELRLTKAGIIIRTLNKLKVLRILYLIRHASELLDVLESFKQGETSFPDTKNKLKTYFVEK